MSSRCQDCHVEIRRQIADKQPMHGKLASAQNCRQCHSEHRGPQAELTSFEHFNHNDTAFQLTGKHETVACTKCHINQTFQATPKTCVACHADPPVHKGHFGENCVDCHNTSSWADHARFDHNATAFKLTGKHQDVACAKCHINQKFKGTAQSCVSCHADPPVHKGRFGENCATCHTTTTWKGATFEHNAFPLNHGGGRQKNLDCTVCHKIPGDYKAYTCYGCHEHRPEKVARQHREVAPAKLENCLDCHSRGHKRRDRRFQAGDDANSSTPSAASEFHELLELGQRAENDHLSASLHYGVAPGTRVPLAVGVFAGEHGHVELMPGLRLGEGLADEW